MQQIIKHLFGADSLQEVSRDRLEEIVEQHPSFAVGRYLLSRKLQEEDPGSFREETLKTNLYFSNPLWLQWLLQNKISLNQPKVERSRRSYEPSATQQQPEGSHLPDQRFEEPSSTVPQPEEESFPAPHPEVSSIPEQHFEDSPKPAQQSEELPVHELPAEDAPTAPAPAEEPAFAEEPPTVYNHALIETSLADNLADIPTLRGIRDTSEEGLISETNPSAPETYPEAEEPSERAPGFDEHIREGIASDEKVIAETTEVPSNEASIEEERFMHDDEPSADPVSAENSSLVGSSNEASSNDTPYHNPSSSDPDGNTSEVPTEDNGDNGNKGLNVLEGLRGGTLAITEQTPIFESYHTIDYFASQGIKLSLDLNPNDRLGKQMRSFTEWLKTMRKVPLKNQEFVPPDPDTENNIQTIAAHSIEGKEVLTETMAEVLAKQGMYDKAVDVYNKLSLLNPGKRAYFATKIEQLKIE